MKSNKKMLIKLVSTMILFVILILNINIVQAVTIKPREEITDKLNKYPGYTELIDTLKKAHPNWNFRILYTGLDWNQVIKNEAVHQRNLVPYNRTSAWICSVCGNNAYDNGSWRCASEAAISYYIDPRNSLNEEYVFQFESLSYNKDVQTIEGVKQIIKDVQYMQGDKITYTKTDGTQGVINKTYAQVIMEAAEESNVSPYHLAARIRQEQGTGSSPSALADGKWPGYIGYYNFFNIKASGNGSSQIIANGLTYAKNKGFTDPELSIKGGAKFLANDYIACGQYTLYLQKFDVDDSDGTLYYFQYMQNLSASKSEGTKARESYQKLGLLDTKIDFIIPVFENMPDYLCPEPANSNIVTQNVKVTGNNVRIRKDKSATSEIIKEVNSGYKMLRIELAEEQIEGYYWDKVVFEDGKQGYVARNYIEQIGDIKDCEEQVIVTTNTNLRNGPGLNGTTIITTIIKGQLITRVEKDKYNLDGYVWDRVLLPDGRQGYVAQKYVAQTTNNSTENTQNEITNEIIKVICSGLRIRKEPGTDKIVSGYAERGSTLTRVEQAVSNANGYVWDKVVTANGIEGYIARGDSNEDYIEVVSVIKIDAPNDNQEKQDETKTNENNNNDTNKDNENVTNNDNNEKPNENITNNDNNEKANENTENTNNNDENQNKPSENPDKPNQNEQKPEEAKKIEDYKNDKMKIENNYLICIPEATIQDLKQLFNDKNVNVTNKDKEEVTEGNLATGYVINIEDKAYTVVKLGDVNGDGKINSGDLFNTQKYLLKQLQFSDILIKACDVNKDGKINSGDLFYMQKYLLKQTKLSI